MKQKYQGIAAAITGTMIGLGILWYSLPKPVEPQKDKYKLVDWVFSSEIKKDTTDQGIVDIIPIYTREKGFDTLYMMTFGKYYVQVNKFEQEKRFDKKYPYSIDILEDSTGHQKFRLSNYIPETRKVGR